MSALVELDNLEKRFSSGRFDVHALRGITLRIDTGEFVAVMGPSGSGKTTLLEILGCLSRPTVGRYRFRGHDISTASAKELSRLRGEEIGFVFQSFNLLPRLSAVENIELPLIYRKVAGRERRARALDALGRVGMVHRARHRPPEMSGGERQRVAIARAIVNRPAVILADEPTGNLDSASGEHVLGLLRDLHDEGNTVVMVTHDPGIGDRVDRRLQILDGKIQSDERTS